MVDESSRLSFARLQWWVFDRVMPAQIWLIMSTLLANQIKILPSSKSRRFLMLLFFLFFSSSSSSSPKLKSLLSFWQKRGLMWTLQRYIHPDACCFPGNAQLPLQITRGTEMWIRNKSVQPVQITWLHVTQLRVWACQGLPDPFLLTSETRAGEFGSSRLLDWLLLAGF